MSFHLHMLNLREDATSQDIRQLFSGMSVQDGGVTIIGGEDGEAFVTFTSQSDLLKAMQRDGEQNLKFKIATDVDKLTAINRMCIAKIQKIKEADSFSKQGEYSKDNNVQAVDREQGHCGDRGKRHYIWDSSNTHSSCSPKRMAGGNCHIDRSPDEHGQDTHKETSQHYSQPQMEYLPWVTSEPKSKSNSNCSFPPTPAQIPNQVHEGPILPYASITTRLPGFQAGTGFAHALESIPQQSVSNSSFPTDTTPTHTPNQFQRGRSCSYTSIPSQVPCDLPVAPGFQAGVNFTPQLMPQQKSVFKSGRVTASQGSLLRSLLPETRRQRYCIQVFDLPPDVTPSMVWESLGGPQGAAIGVILLKPTNDYPVAFMVYAHEFKRDQRLGKGKSTEKKISAIATCLMITDFINNWTKWKGTRKLNSPIFETGQDLGKDKYVELESVYEFSQNSADKSRNRPKSTNYPVGSYAEKFAGTIEAKYCQNVFLLVYQLKLTVSATEVLSWFSDGLSALKVNFPGEDGPKGSESIAFILFPNKETASSAQVVPAGKGLDAILHACGRVYNMIYQFGNKCIVTESSSDGDHIISPEERKQPPFFGIESQPKAHQFNLANSMDMEFLHLKGIPRGVAPKVVWSWYPNAKGVIVMKNRMSIDAIEAVVAFETEHACLEAAKRVSGSVTVFGKSKWKFQKMLSSQETLLLLSRERFEMMISTEQKQPDRRLTVEEAKFIVSQSIREVPKPQTISNKSQITPGESASFLNHMKSLSGPTENQQLYLMLLNVEKELTACEVNALFPDALCAVKVNFNSNGFGPGKCKAAGFLLLNDTEARKVARLLLENYAELWRCLEVPAGVPEHSNIFQNFRRTSVEQFLFCICHKSTIFESSPAGVDRVLSMEDLGRGINNPPFTLVHDPPSLHYVKLIGYDKDISASDLWTWFYCFTDEVKGVVLLVRKADPMEYIACIAFDSDKLDRILKTKKGQFAQYWSSVSVKTEKQVLAFLMKGMKGSKDYDIKVSTEAGLDRDLVPIEEEILGFQTNVETQKKSRTEKLRDVKMTNKQTDGQQTKGQIIGKLVEGKGTNPPIGTKHGFYIRLKKVPAEVTTAWELLSLYTDDAAPAKIATFVRDCNGKGVSAYVMFDEEENRDSALLKCPFSVCCTAYGRAVRLAEYEPEYEILESTKRGHDVVMSAEERDNLEEQFN